MTTDPNQPPLPDEPPLQEPGEHEPAQPDAGQDRPSDQQSGQQSDQEVLGAPAPQGGDQTERDPQHWVTGDDPATEAQKTYLDTLARSAGEEIPAQGLTKAQASEHIDRLQAQTGQQPRQD